MRLKPRIVAGVLAVTMAVSLLQYPSVSVRAEEVVSQGAEDAAVKDDGIANEARNKTTPSITQNQEQEEVQEPVNESDADVSIDDSENNDSTENQESGTEDGSISNDGENAGENAGDNTTEDEDGEEVNPEDGSNDNTEQDKTNEATDGSEVEDDENIPDETKTGEEIPDELNEELLQDAMLDVNEETVDDGVSAMALETSGTCGKNLVWELVNGTLTISGIGEMDGHRYSRDTPWYEQRETIEKIVIQKGVTSIGGCAFAGCSNLVSVDIPEGVENIGGNAFEACKKLTEIHLPEGLKTISISAFMDCELLPHINLPQSLSLLNNDAFYNCTSLESVTIPGGLAETGTSAFGKCQSLKSVVIEEGVTSISGSTFSSCISLESVKIPKSVTYIGRNAFSNCKKLTSVDIPEGVTRIVQSTFSGCESLTSIKIPRSVTEFGEYAFEDCNNLSDIYYGGSESEWNEVAISPYNTPYITNATIHYNCSEPEKTEYKVYCGPGYPDGYESFDISLEECMEKTSSTSYNPQLAHMLMAMCNSVFSQNNMRETFNDFGFERRIFADELMLSYAIATKQTDDSTLVLVVARGTEDVEEWISNADISLNDKGHHSGFANAADVVYKKITELGIDVNNVKFVITGFSRGAAATNLLAARLIDENVNSENVYAYAFACPDTLKIDTDEVEADRYKCIFNVANVKDIVSWVPSTLLNDSWKKYGESYWYCENWSDYQDLEMGISAHNQEKYLSYLRSEQPKTIYRHRSSAKSALDSAALTNYLHRLGYKNATVPYTGFYCPVNVYIYTSNGELAGSVVDNIPEIKLGDKVYISVKNDQKHIYYLDNDTFTLRLTGTDDGTMVYTAQNIVVETGESVGKQDFENVALISNKQFLSEIKVTESIAVDVDIKEVKLYVLGNDDKPEKEVLADGNGTEVPIEEGEPGDNPDDNKPGEDEPGGNDPSGNPGDNKPGDDTGNKPDHEPGGSSGSKPGNNSGSNTTNNTSNSNKTQSSRKTTYEEDSDAQIVVESWKPTTPDEKKRYACMGKDIVQYTLAKDNAYRIVIKNAMQGPLCFKSFESVLGDYAIGRTYNVYTLPDTVYSMEQEIQFTIKIPPDIYQAGREYKMICVTKNGLPIVYNDIDNNPETITIKTNKFYAYALIYV